MAKANLKLSHGGPTKDRHQTPTNRIKLNVRDALSLMPGTPEETIAILQPDMQTVA